MSPRARSADRERAILDAAREVFIEHGFENARMLDIATRAQVGKGTLYGIAPSKEDLFLRVVLDCGQGMIHEFSASMQPSGDPLNSLRAILLGMVGSLEAQAPLTWMSIELLARASSDESLRQRVLTSFRSMYAQFFAPVQTLIETAKEKGQLGDVDAEAFSRLMAALIDGLVFQAMFEGDRLPRERIIQTFMQLADAIPAAAHAQREE
jgi:AcrR family transcriptional regulator